MLPWLSIRSDCAKLVVRAISFPGETESTTMFRRILRLGCELGEDLPDTVPISFAQPLIKLVTDVATALCRLVGRWLFNMINRKHIHLGLLRG